MLLIRRGVCFGCVTGFTCSILVVSRLVVILIWGAISNFLGYWYSRICLFMNQSSTLCLYIVSYCSIFGLMYRLCYSIG